VTGGSRLSIQKAVRHDLLVSLPRRQAAKKAGILVWLSASKFLALSVSDSFGEIESQLSNFPVYSMLVECVAALGLYAERPVERNR